MFFSAPTQLNLRVTYNNLINKLLLLKAQQINIPGSALTSKSKPYSVGLAIGIDKGHLKIQFNGLKKGFACLSS